MDEKEVPVFIEGKNICLIPQNSENINLYVKWLNNPKVRIYSRNILPKRVEDIKKWFEPHERGAPGFIGFEIWHKKDKKTLGTVGLGWIDWINGWTNVGLTIGEPAYWNKNIATEATELIIEYAFNELNLNKLHGGVCVKNVASWSVAEKLGFKFEGTREKEWYVDGEYLGLKTYCLLKEDWLKMNQLK
ncbi:MAG: GNAT family N-acetyltransferase [Promethearchaeota archaeon]